MPWVHITSKKEMTDAQLRDFALPLTLPPVIESRNVSDIGVVWADEKETPVITDLQKAEHGELTMQSGEYFLPWVVKDRFSSQEEAEVYQRNTLNAAIIDIRNDINEKRRKVLEAGFTYNFQDGTPGVVEIRKESDDKANIMGIVLSGMNLVQAGNFTPTDDEKPFYIDQADVKHLLTGPEAVAFGQAVFDWVGKIYDVANQHKKTFETNNPATGEAWTAEEIWAYDFSGGWEV